MIYYKGFTFCQHTNNAGNFLHNTDTFRKRGRITDPADQPRVTGDPENGWELVRAFSKTLYPSEVESYLAGKYPGGHVPPSAKMLNELLKV